MYIQLQKEKSIKEEEKGLVIAFLVAREKSEPHKLLGAYLTDKIYIIIISNYMAADLYSSNAQPHSPVWELLQLPEH